MGKGTRFNAHKAHVADYFTSKIYEFTTKCRACADCEFKIRTNPKEQCFDYVSGIRKKVEEFDSAEAGALGVVDTDAGAGIYQYKNGKLVGADGKGEDAALQALETSARGERKAMTEYEQMESLYQVNTRMEEDADVNALLRKGYRKERKAKKRRLEDAKKMGLGRGIFLSGETDQDITDARVTIGLRDHQRVSDSAFSNEKNAFGSIRSGGIFSSSKKIKSKSDKNRTKRNDTSDNTTGIMTKKADTIRKGKKRIVVCPQSTTNGTRMEIKEEIQSEPGPSKSAISALAAYGSDSD